MNGALRIIPTESKWWKQHVAKQALIHTVVCLNYSIIDSPFHYTVQNSIRVEADTVSWGWSWCADTRIYLLFNLSGHDFCRFFKRNSRIIYIIRMCVLVLQSCLTLWDPMDYSLPGSFLHGVFQARILEWVAMPFSRGSSWPRDWAQVSCTAGRCFTFWATREALVLNIYVYIVLNI